MTRTKTTTRRTLHSEVQRDRLVTTVAAFLDRKIAYGGTLSSDGGRLYSYLVVIGEWDGGRIKVLPKDKFYSRTTTRHCRMLMDLATFRGISIIEM